MKLLPLSKKSKRNARLGEACGSAVVALFVLVLKINTISEILNEK